ncbi:MAG: cytochrome c3 family protein [Elusimicrobia bacterium]|nr:cytochrome c3 family protein [Elusimicrobiota bacterium]
MKLAAALLLSLLLVPCAHSAPGNPGGEPAGDSYVPSASAGYAPSQPLADKVTMPDEGFGVSVPGLVVMLFFLGLAAAVWQIGLPPAAVVLLALAVASGYWAFGGRRYYHLVGDEQGYSPVQPIAFSHKIHAGTLKISCMYCHYGAAKSDVAGVPPMNVCMNCHKEIRTMAGEDRPNPDIERLVSDFHTPDRDGKPSLQWVRIHRLPNFVHFTHRAHIANNIQCQECHGPVQTMDRVRQAAPLSMGWCLSCHRMTKGEAPAHWRKVGGPTDCIACHR